LSDLERERARTQRFGFAALAAWAALGFALEAAHALKLSAYLDHPLRRELLRWAHAHGVGLALVVLAAAASGLNEGAQRFVVWLRRGAVLMPLGFASSVFGHSEADPGPSIWLVPIGAFLTIGGLAGIARALPKP
jgi:hypothetical protein